MEKKMETTFYLLSIEKFLLGWVRVRGLVVDLLFWAQCLGHMCIFQDGLFFGGREK